MHHKHWDSAEEALFYALQERSRAILLLHAAGARPTAAGSPASARQQRQVDAMSARWLHADGFVRWALQAMFHPKRAKPPAVPTPVPAAVSMATTIITPLRTIGPLASGAGARRK